MKRVEVLQQKSFMMKYMLFCCLFVSGGSEMGKHLKAENAFFFVCSVFCHFSGIRVLAGLTHILMYRAS